MLVPATTVPVTIIGAFAAMALLGFTVNLMTLFALILAIGIVVDDAIVIVENASHYIEQGLTPKDAAIKAMSELTGPVLGITLVLTSVFLPASFLPGITGQMFRQFALVIASTAIISALNALTLKPTQCALYLRPIPKDKKVNWFFRKFNEGFAFIEGALHRDGPVDDESAVDGWPSCSLSSWASAPPPSPSIRPRSCRWRTRATASSSRSFPREPRSRACAQLASSIDGALKGIAGLKGWVTIGGYSAMDSAKMSNVITAFVVFDDWGKRPRASPWRAPSRRFGTSST